MKKNENEKEFCDFAKKFRLILLEAGYSPDSHLHALTPLYLFTRAKEEAVRKLIKMRLLFEGLSDKERKVFVNDILERDRSYPFWYYGSLGAKERDEMRRSLLKRASLAMGGAA